MAKTVYVFLLPRAVAFSGAQHLFWMRGSKESGAHCVAILNVFATRLRVSSIDSGASGRMHSRPPHSRPILVGTERKRSHSSLVRSPVRKWHPRRPIPENQSTIAPKVGGALFGTDHWYSRAGICQKMMIWLYFAAIFFQNPPLQSITTAASHSIGSASKTA